VPTDPFQSSEILVGVTGGIAAYKAADLVAKLRQRGADVTVAMTANATRFVQPLTFAALSNRRVITDLFDSPDTYHTEHIALAQRIQLAIVAPATANFLAKVAAGIADDALTTAMVSLGCPILLAPAMNHRMWGNAIVQANLARLREIGYRFADPEEGWLACGERGVGRLAKVATLVDLAEQVLREA